MSDKQIFNNIYEGLKKLDFVKRKQDINFHSIKKFKYAYVIYNLNHRQNVDTLLNYYQKKGFDFLGRWGSWEYLNSDQVIAQAFDKAKQF